ncbi:2Fe-2S iron-sulfur cluster-binding protein [Streptomyces sp. GQFP]|uniref:2Fe-2S iron-sulfur cluster-binding protein n=1 Tax=Streptomyces sp. GQFP TaxID=2907545 RepID=UPI001F230CA4|nr:2Fe-2S iron-sulfur cluster-binding protein [Streptomyces sp. GQFP]UIX29389.1 2Fe-2S iron-sulfur cluster-binding protein [Streptomyces sp. GQFP]
MPKVTFLRPNGDAVVVDAAHGQSVMQAAVARGITEIVAECGGTLACATCHVFVPDEHLDALPPVGPDEEEMLDFTAVPRQAGSRLSCQLPLSAELDGLVVHLPEEQY